MIRDPLFWAFLAVAVLVGIGIVAASVAEEREWARHVARWGPREVRSYAETRTEMRQIGKVMIPMAVTRTVRVYACDCGAVEHRR